MDSWSSIHSSGGTAPSSWREGTVGHSASWVNTATIRRDNATTAVEGGSAVEATYTYLYDERGEASRSSNEFFGPGSYRLEAMGSGMYSSKAEHKHSPSTYGETVPPSWDLDENGQRVNIQAGYETTHTRDYTVAYNSHEDNKATRNYVTGDTTGSSGYTDIRDGEETVTAYYETFTYLGAITSIQSYTQTDGSWEVTTVLEAEEDTPFQNSSIWTTVSGTLAISTNATQTKTSTSTWNLAQGSTQNTTAGIKANETPYTYAADRTTVKALTSERPDGTGGVETYTSPVSTETITRHAYSQKIDTVAMLHGGRQAPNFNLGDLLWSFSLADFPADGSTTGRFTDLFGAAGAATVTLADYEKYWTNEVAVSQITVSKDTVVSTRSVSTRTAAGDAGLTTKAVPATVYGTSKNGERWAAVETYEKQEGDGTVVGHRELASNYRTVSHLFQIGDVGTSLSTWKVGELESSTTYFTHTVQVSGYDPNFSWTASIEQASFHSSSFSEVRLALWSSTTTSMAIFLRSTTLDTVLIESNSSYMEGTNKRYFLFGKVSTETTRVYSVSTTTSQSLYDEQFNVEVQQWTTQSQATFEGGASGSSEGVNHKIDLTHKTKLGLVPKIHDAADAFLYEEVDRAWFSVLPHGYAGFGGTFDASNMTVYSTVSAGLASGSAFPGQEFATEVLPTVLAYSRVTLFPANTGSTFAMLGAARARYVTGLDGIGTATVAATWTSTTTATTSSGTASKVTSRFATYTVKAVSPIAGTFLSEEHLSFNSVGGLPLSGGYGIGDNNLGHPYTVFAGYGYAAWSEYAAGDSTAAETGSTSGSNGSVSFTVPGSKGIVFEFESILTANWTGGGGVISFYFSSTPHVRLS